MIDVGATRGRWREILEELGVDDRTLAGKHCACPFCGGTDRFRFTDHAGKGIWICNACGSGDGFHFVQRLFGLDFKHAAERVMQVLPSLVAAPVKPPPKRRPTNPIVRLNHVWHYAQPLKCTLASIYLGGRLGYVPDTSALRGGLVEYFEDGRRIGKLPAMIAMVRDASGKPRTLHVTYLSADGSRKADVKVQRKVLSAMGEGAHVRLFEPGRVLAVAEGIETALAVHRETGLPVWSTICANGMKGVWKAIPEGVREVRVFADNDANGVGQAAARELCAKIRATGRGALAYTTSTSGTDFASPGVWNCPLNMLQ